jgi:hypothetical protein
VYALGWNFASGPKSEHCHFVCKGLDHLKKRAFVATALSLAIFIASVSVHAQTANSRKNSDPQAPTMLPIWNTLNNKMEGFLLIDPNSNTLNPNVIRPASSGPSLNIPVNAKLQFGAGLNLKANPGLGLFCSGQSTPLNSLGNLAQNCRVGDLLSNNNGFGTQRPDLIAQSQLRYKNFLLSASGNWSQFNFNAFSPSKTNAASNSRSSVIASRADATAQERGVSVNGQIPIGQQGWVTIGGSSAQVRVIPASQLPGSTLPDEWRTNSITLGGGRGNFGGEVTSSNIEIPGTSKSFQRVGAGVTWKTPWRGKLSVGAENINPKATNPFKSSEDNPLDNGAVPFVKYEVDL